MDMAHSFLAQTSSNQAVLHELASMPHLDIPTANGIDLWCMVCPKTPTFSDLSHLLTHLSSKAHLNKYNILKLDALDSDSSALRKDNFDKWEADNGLARLCKDRQDQKGRKKNGAAAAATNTSRRVNQTGNNSRTLQVTGRRLQARDLRESTLDPQLGPRIKIEDGSRAGTPTSFNFDQAAISRAFAPSMGNNASTPYSIASTLREPSVLDNINTDSSCDSPYMNVAPRKSTRGSKRTKNWAEDSDDDEDAEYYNGKKVMKTHEEPFAKHGFPGVHCMDAATKERKRMRNQKKDDSAIIELQNVSKSISPREIIFQDGVACRDREITGVPNSDDGLAVLPGEGPFEPSSSPPKKRQPKQTRVAPLTRAAPLRPRKANPRYGEWASSLRHKSFQAGANPAFPYVNLGDVNDGMTFGGPERLPGGIRVHHDNSGPNITFNGATHMGTLTSSLYPPQPVQQGAFQQGAFPPGPYQQGQYQRQPGCEYSDNYNHDLFGPPLSSSTLPAANGSNNNPLNINTPNFGSFGQLNNLSMNGAFGNPLSSCVTSNIAGIGMLPPTTGAVPSQFPAPALPRATYHPDLFTTYEPKPGQWGPPEFPRAAVTPTAHPMEAYENGEVTDDPLAAMEVSPYGFPGAFPAVDEALVLGSNDDEETISAPNSGA